MPVRILLADDHTIVREGFRTLLERARFEIAGEASDGWTAVRLAQSRQPDVVVLDLSMPLLNGTEAAREILAIAPRMPIVLLTVHVDEHYVVAALRAGIRGYVVKSQASAELIEAIGEVRSGGTFISPRVAGALVDAYLGGRATVADPLTLREREVLQLVAEGKTTKDIAAALDLTTKTAEYYRSRIMTKLGVHNTAGLVRYALHNGVVHLVAAFSWLAIYPDIFDSLQRGFERLLM
jgi:DNA-binding NarL/FixJ family response regulator